jgi:UDP-N-acetylglucosamine--dolichyl-phosphate N-acetylglucosaminephosphotransferase
MNIYYIIAISLALTLVLTKVSIVRLKKLGIVSSDLHKKGQPKKPKIGGIAIAFGFSIGMILAYYFRADMTFVLVLLAFLVSAIVGLMDDFLGFKAKQKLILPALAAIPLLWFIPWEVSSIILLFAGVAIVSNWTNMLAGFNGLEIGLGCIALFFLALSSPAAPALILLIYSACLLAFLFFNKYPAQIFPGDVGTLPIGTIMVACIFLGAPVYVLALLLIPYFVDASLKFFSAGVFSSSKFRPSSIRNGYLVPGKSYLSLSTLLMNQSPRREAGLVLNIWMYEIALGLITLVI